MLAGRLDHLSEKCGESIRTILMTSKVVATNLKVLRTSSVLFRHTFDLSVETPIYHAARRFSPKYTEVVRKEIDDMLETRIIVSASSAWSFSVVIATKKNEKPRFCADFRALNKRIKVDRFPLPKIQEIFEELGGGDVFSTSDLFSGYRQIRLEESFKEEITFVYRFGTFKFELMPFGFMNATSTF